VNSIETAPRMNETVLLLHPSADHARIVLNRPERHNALGLDELCGLARAVDALVRSPPRVVSIVAEGPSFSVGGDVIAIADALALDRMEPWLREAIGHFNRAMEGLNALDAAVVAGAQGAAAGGALGLLWAADHVIGAEDLVLDLAYARLGASPDGGTSWALPRRVGPLRAFELFALSPRLHAVRAVDWGLVNRTVPAPALREAVDRVVDELLRVPAQTLVNFKRLLRDAPSRGLGEHLREETEAFVRAGQQPEFARRVELFAGARRGR